MLRKKIFAIDYRIVFFIVLLMCSSLFVISSATLSFKMENEQTFFTPQVIGQLRFFMVGGLCFLLFSAIDYHVLRKWALWIYLLTLIALLGLFFVGAIQNVHRWYRVPFLPFALQPSEFAKISVVIILSWFLEYRKEQRSALSTAVIAMVLVIIPFLFILKEPDLGSAFVLLPIMLVMFYIGNVHKATVKAMLLGGSMLLAFIVCIFLGLISHENLKPKATVFLKDYQFERLNPDNYHQKASQTAISLGKINGSGFRQSELTAQGWLPFAYTDSVFPAFVEEYGLIGGLVLLAIYFGLIYYCFQVTAVARDDFGYLLASGLATMLAMHSLINIGMMCGLLPITGVPLVLMSSGGSSIVASMIALGIIQSVYARRFMF